MLKIFSAQIENHFPLLQLKINLLLCNCTMRVIRLTENKLIYLVLATVGSKKNFFLYETALCISKDISPKQKKCYYIEKLSQFFMREHLVEENCCTTLNKTLIIVYYSKKTMFIIIIPKKSKNETFHC